MSGRIGCVALAELITCAEFRSYDPMVHHAPTTTDGNEKCTDEIQIAVGV